MHSSIVHVLFSRVAYVHSNKWVDLEVLESIEMGYGALRFKDDESSENTELVMQSNATNGD